MPATIKIHPSAIAYALFDHNITLLKATAINNDANDQDYGSITFSIEAEGVADSGEYEVVILPPAGQGRYVVTERRQYSFDLIPSHLVPRDNT